MSQVGLALEQVTLLVITHAHPDHWGQAAPIVSRAGCEMWMHPDHEDAFARVADPDAYLQWRLEVGRQSGVSEKALAEYAQRESETPVPVAGIIEPDRPLVQGATFESDLGTWHAYETPGHSPSHVCLYQPEHRLLVSGDHLLGRTSLFFDYGDTPDPVAQYVESLHVIAALRARLALSGHGKPFLDVPGHIADAHRMVDERLAVTLAALGAEPRTALEVTLDVDPDRPPEIALSQTLCMLEHLEHRGRTQRSMHGDVTRWRAVPQS